MTLKIHSKIEMLTWTANQKGCKEKLPRFSQLRKWKTEFDNF